MSEISGCTEADLVKRLKNENRAAFREIFNRYREKLLFYSVSIVKQDGVGKDIVQETFIRLWTNRENVDPEKSLSGYLHTITRNLSLNHLKSAGYDQALKKRIWTKIEEQQQRNTTEEDLFARECKDMVENAIKLLPNKRRQIFRLSRDKGLTHKEIAAQLNISSNTVKNQIVAASKAVRAYLQKYSDVAISWLIIFSGYWF